MHNNTTLLGADLSLHMFYEFWKFSINFNDLESENKNKNLTYPHEVTGTKIWRPISQESGYTTQL
jgi:hypothetical protein